MQILRFVTCRKEVNNEVVAGLYLLGGVSVDYVFIKNNPYRIDLTDNCNVGEMTTGGPSLLIVVVSDALELGVKIVEPRQKLHLRGVAADNFEALGKESFDDEPAAVVLQSGGCKHLPEADLLLPVEPEQVFLTWSWGLGVTVSLTGHSMDDLGFDLGEHRPPCRASVFVGQRYTSLPSGDGYSSGIRRGQFLSRKSSSETKNHGQILRCNITRVFRD